MARRLELLLSVFTLFSSVSVYGQQFDLEPYGRLDYKEGGEHVTFVNRFEDDLLVHAVIFQPQEGSPDRHGAAVVLAHGSGGLFKEQPLLTFERQFQEWSEMLTKQGYYAILPASFYSRGYKDWNSEFGDDWENSDKRIRNLHRVRDMYAAGEYIRDHRPEIDIGRVGLMGFSNGGTSTWMTPHRAIAEVEGLENLEDSEMLYNVAVSWYPGCFSQGLIDITTDTDRLGDFYQPLINVTILHGENDPINAHCRTRVNQVEILGSGTPGSLTYHEYEDADHSFDIKENTDSNEFARHDGRQRGFSIFEDHLGYEYSGANDNALHIPVTPDLMTAERDTDSGELVTYTTPDGTEVTGVFFPASSSTSRGGATVVFNHLNGGLFSDLETPTLKIALYREWAHLLTNNGYNAFFPASFYSRGYADWSSYPSSTSSERNTFRTLDAIGAADYLCSRDDVDCSKIGIMGHASGGTVALLALHSKLDEVPGFESLESPAGWQAYRSPFAFGLTLYPQCGTAGVISTSTNVDNIDEFYHPQSDLLILHGEESGDLATCLSRGTQVRMGDSDGNLSVVPWPGTANGWDSSPDNEQEVSARDAARRSAMIALDRYFPAVL